jgi:hypothetical protein
LLEEFIALYPFIGTLKRPYGLSTIYYVIPIIISGMAGAVPRPGGRGLRGGIFIP